MNFQDRHDAGRKLGQRLMFLVDENPLVLGLPRGGIPVAYEVARALHAPLDLFIVRKLGVPGHVELAMGAIASGGVRVLNEEVIQIYRIQQEVIEYVTAQEKEKLELYEREFRGGMPPPEVRERTVILVDDGLATGSTMRAAVAALRQLAPSKIVAAVPVAAGEPCQALAGEVDEIVCLLTPEPFYAVGSWYKNFEQTSDEEVRSLLRLAER